jgi:tetratricopeptide (TPR) repeat protein
MANQKVSLLCVILKQQMLEPYAANQNDVLQNLAKRLLGLNLFRPGLAVAIWGDPGIGKTFGVRRLLELTPLASAQVHASQSLRDILQVLPQPQQMPAWASALLDRLEAGETLSKAQQLELMSSFLDKLSPFVLHIEDLHEGSFERAELILALAQKVLHLPGVGLIVTSRSKPLPPFEAIRLEPLNRLQTAQLLELEASAPLPAEALDWVFLRALGNPLFTLEYFRFLSRQGFLYNDGKRWRWRDPEREIVPVTVEALIERVLQSASQHPNLERLIGVKAILGFQAPRTVLVEVLGVSLKELQVLENELEGYGILRQNEFAHPLYRELGLGNLQPEIRRQLARRALEILEEIDVQAAAALVALAELPSELAIDLLSRAAGSARAAGRPVQAARFLAEASGLSAGETRASFAFQAAQGLRHSDVTQAMRLAEIASESRVFRSDAIFLIAELQAVQLQGAQAERNLERLTPTEQASPLWLARRLQLRSIAGNHIGALEILDQNPNLLEHSDANTLHRVVVSLASLGRPEEAEQLLSPHLERDLSSSDQLVLLKAAGVVAYFKNDFERMDQLNQRVYQMAFDISDLRLMDAAVFNRALALEYLGRYFERMECLERALSICRELGDSTAYVIAQVAYAGALTDLGEYEQAEAMLLEAHAVLARTDASVYLLDCETAFEKLYRDWRPAYGGILALKHAQAALECGKKSGNPRHELQGLAILGLAQSWAGDAQLALAISKDGLSQLEQLNLPALTRQFREVEAYALLQLGDSRALGSLQDLELEAQKLGDRIGAHMIGLELDRITNDVERVRQRKAWFEGHGLKNGLKQIQRLFPELEQTKPSDAQNPIRLEVLGAIQFDLNGVKTPVKGRKRQELLAMLLEARIAGRSEVSKLELLDMLYPEGDEVRSSSSLKEVVRQVRSIFGQQTIQTTLRGYALGSLQSDAEEFLEHFDTQLWCGAYLNGLVLEQTDDQVRNAIHFALRECLLKLAARPKEVIRLSKILLEFDPYDLVTIRARLQALVLNAPIPSINREYDSFKSRFLEVGERLPESWQALLEENLRV